MFWETARPYLYVRETADGRVLVGGQDIPFRSAVIRNALIRRQARRLMRRYARLFGEKLEPAHTWAGHFASTADGLPHTLDEVFGFERLSRQNIFPAGR